MSLGHPSAIYKTSSTKHCALQPVLSVRRDFGLAHYRILGCEKRFITVAAGRRWGKTTVALFKLLCHAASARGQVCYYIAPTERQAKEMGWRTLKQIVPRALIWHIRESDLEVELVNGSIIKMHGPESLRGTGLDFAVLDEFAYAQAELWPETVRPMLADREGKALLVSTPRGFNYFYDLHQEAKGRPEWAAFHYETEPPNHGFFTFPKIDGFNGFQIPTPLSYGSLKIRRLEL